ncbi:hypothetical protein ACWCXL_27340 [Streptomyces sp. NPDC001588]
MTAYASCAPLTVAGEAVTDDAGDLSAASGVDESAAGRVELEGLQVVEAIAERLLQDVFLGLRGLAFSGQASDRSSHATIRNFS